MKISRAGHECLAVVKQFVRDRHPVICVTRTAAEKYFLAGKYLAHERVVFFDQALPGEELREVILRSNRGFVVITGAGPVAILVTVARNESNLGLVVLDARKAALSVAATI